jgi:hypothetical protein
MAEWGCVGGQADQIHRPDPHTPTPPSVLIVDADYLPLILLMS